MIGGFKETHKSSTITQESFIEQVSRSIISSKINILVFAGGVLKYSISLKRQINAFSLVLT